MALIWDSFKHGLFFYVSDNGQVYSFSQRAANGNACLNLVSDEHAPDGRQFRQAFRKVLLCTFPDTSAVPVFRKVVIGSALNGVFTGAIDIVGPLDGVEWLVLKRYGERPF